MARPWGLAAGGLLVVTVVVGIVLMSMSWVIQDPGLRLSIAARIAASTGLSIVAEGQMSLRLLPIPRLEMADVGMRGLNGAVVVDAPALDGRLSLIGLLRGDISIASATLDEPTITLDVDRIAPLAANMVANYGAGTKQGATASAEPLAFLRTAGLSIRSGVLRFLSKNPGYDNLLTDISATVEWPSGHGEGGLSGGVTWRGTALTFSAVVDAPDALLLGGASDASLRLRSGLLNLSASGNITLVGGLHGTGSIVASTADLASFLRIAGTPLPQLRAFQQASLTGQATLSPSMISFSDVELGLDDMTFEGAMVMHDDNGHPGVGATMDAARIDLNPFLAALPAPDDAAGVWSEAAFDGRSAPDDDIDLRISVSKARIGPLEFEDGSLSLQSGNGRMEISLGEARAYDGLMKGRVVATFDGGTAEVRADFSVSRLDLAALEKDVPQATGLAGTVTAHIMLEGQGRSYAELMRALAGRAQVSLRNGAVSTRLATGVMTVPSRQPAALASLLSRLGAFDLASADIDVAHGDAMIREGKIQWSDAAASLRGSASIPRRSLALTAVLVPGPNGDGAEVAPLPFSLAGPWRDLTLTALDSGPPLFNAVGR